MATDDKITLKKTQKRDKTVADIKRITKRKKCIQTSFKAFADWFIFVKVWIRIKPVSLLFSEVRNQSAGKILSKWMMIIINYSLTGWAPPSSVATVKSFLITFTSLSCHVLVQRCFRTSASIYHLKYSSNTDTLRLQTVRSISLMVQRTFNVRTAETKRIPQRSSSHKCLHRKHL